MNTWNIVEKGTTKIMWKDLNETNIEEIKDLENKAKTKPYFCKLTNSVVFKTEDENIKVVKGPDYSELELVSRYLTTENKLYDLLQS